jgi:hypothetical protein
LTRPLGRSASGAGVFGVSSASGITPTTVPLSSAAAASKTTSGAPILTRSPGAPINSAMRPDWGEGISTTAFSVSTETRGWSVTT